MLIIYGILEAQKDSFQFYHLVASDVVALIAMTPHFNVAAPVSVLLGSVPCVPACRL